MTRLLGCEEAAQDVAQDAFLRFHASRDRSGIQKPRAYLFRIAHNLAVDRIVRESRTRSAPAAPNEEEALAESFQPDAVVETEQRWQIIAAALNELPRACRDAFVMNKLRGLTHTQIAAELGVSKSMVEKHLMRAMSHCRNRLRQNS